MDLVIIPLIIVEVMRVNEKILTKLMENYRNIEKILTQELMIDENSVTSSAEEIWQPIFQRIVPTKYNVEKNVYIIDSYKNVSEKISLAIYDEQYTPYIFNYGSIKYIPIEAVFAVVLCKKPINEKKDSTDASDQVTEWLESVQNLKTDLNAYVRIQSGLLDNTVDRLSENFMAHKKNCKDDKCTIENPKCNDSGIMKQTQTATRPITILCTTNNSTKQREFDIMLSVNQKNETIIKEIPAENATLDQWYKWLNHCDEQISKKIKGLIIQKVSSRTLKDLNIDENNVLLSLMFQLNQLLMIINNPIFFPHQSYAKAFQEGK